VYGYAYHRTKLEFVRTGALDDKRAATDASTARFASLADFLESIPTTCPHDLFRRDDDEPADQLSALFRTMNRAAGRSRF